MCATTLDVQCLPALEIAKWPPKFRLSLSTLFAFRFVVSRLVLKPINVFYVGFHVTIFACYLFYSNCSRGTTVFNFLIEDSLSYLKNLPSSHYLLVEWNMFLNEICPNFPLLIPCSCRSYWSCIFLHPWLCIFCYGNCPHHPVVFLSSATGK